MMLINVWCTGRRTGVLYFDNVYSIFSVSCPLEVRFIINAKEFYGVMAHGEKLCVIAGIMPYFWLMASVWDRQCEQFTAERVLQWVMHLCSTTRTCI